MWNLLLVASLGCAPKPVPVAPGPAPTAGLVEVTGMAARVPARELLLRTLATAVVAPCYEASLARDAGAYGEVVVAFTALADGTVEAASVHLSTLGDAEAEACVVRAVGALAFPGVTAERLSVLYPFVFTSDNTPPEAARALKARYKLLPPETEGDPTDPKAETPSGMVYLW